jgi:Ni,Fe-hydrogenase I large subunit
MLRARTQTPRANRRGFEIPKAGERRGVGFWAEETSDPKEFRGIDVLRAIRSFDPCMPCTTHIHSDAGVISREVNTCACGADD